MVMVFWGKGGGWAAYFSGTGSPTCTCKPQCLVAKAKWLGPLCRAVRCSFTSVMEAALYGRTRETSSKGWLSQSALLLLLLLLLFLLLLFMIGGCRRGISATWSVMALNCRIKPSLSTPTRPRSCVRCQWEKSLYLFPEWKESWTLTPVGRMFWATWRISPP